MIKKYKWHPSERIILTDADGVLLDWEWAFSIWMQEHGFQLKPDNKLTYWMEDRYGVSPEQMAKLVTIFNESAAIGFLPPLRDAMYYVRRLHELHGFKFHCITSVSSDPNAQKLRTMNLQKLFGDTVFDRIVCLDMGAPKKEILVDYTGSNLWWIEDKISNAEDGLDVGLRSILMEHGHNMNHKPTRPLPILKNWKEIYETITEVGKI